MYYPIQYAVFIIIISVFATKTSSEESFNIEFQWSYFNFTWNTSTQYTQAVKESRYIPQNIFATGIKLYRDKIYLATPKFRNGVPASLNYIPKHPAAKKNIPLTPFPNWKFNDDRSCQNLQSVQSLEIDSKGILWVIDGVRINRNKTDCPAKLVLLDLNKNGSLVHTYEFPNEVCLRNGGFLRDIVIEEDQDGDFGYMTDASNIDPGLIVYSRAQNRSWKLRDRTMFPEMVGPVFKIDNHLVDIPVPIDGIALSPKIHGKHRLVFYAPLSGFDFFSVPTGPIRDEQLYKNGSWRNYIQLVGRKPGSTDGMTMDNEGNLYYSLVSLNAVGRWNVNDSYEDSEVLYQDNKTLIWPDSFGWDQAGFLYLIANRAVDYLNTKVKLNLNSEIKFRIFRYHSGAKSYLYQ